MAGRVTRRIVVWLMAFALVGGLAACSVFESSPGNVTVVGIDCERFGSEPVVAESVEIAVGDALEVRLCSNPSTGFTWEDPTWEGAATLELVSRQDLEHVDAVPGAPGQESFTFKAIVAGETLVHFEYSQPWAGGTKGEWQVDLTVTVR